MGNLKRALAAASLLLGTLTFGVISPASAAPGDCVGTVFRDYNANGVQDGIESGEAGIIATAYDDTGSAVGTATTDATGAFDIDTSVAVGTPLRIEFTWPDSPFLESGPNGADNASSVQFADAGSCNLTFGVMNPGEYCQSDPRLALTCSVFGAYDGAFSGLDSIAGDLYSSGGSSGTAASDYDNGNEEHYSTFGDTGSLYGAAWDRTNETYYSAAFAKNYSGYGPGGPGALYETPIDPVTGVAGASALWLDIYTLAGVHTCVDNHGDDLLISEGPELLPAMFADVGRCSMADIELSEDGETLYVVNLDDANNGGQVLAIDVATKTLVGTPWAIPDPGNCPNPTTDLHPGALAVSDGYVYLGVTCGADSTDDFADMRFYVYRMDPATGTPDPATPVLDEPFTQRTGSLEIYAWQNDPTDIPSLTDPADTQFPTRAQLWLTDIGIQGDHVTLGFRDLFGDQMGSAVPDAAGELIYAIGKGEVLCAGLAGTTMTLESGDVCNGKTGDPGSADQGGPGGNEFYNDGDGAHLETGLGGVAAIPGFDTVAFTLVNPAEIFATGTRFYTSGWVVDSTDDGSAQRGRMMLRSNRPGDPPETFGKGGALGDVEALCQAAPLEIGNYVWFDVDGDGIQDPSEAPVIGATVTLYDDGGTQVGQVTTDSNGQYYFPVDPNSDYTIVMDNPADYASGGVLFEWDLTGDSADVDDDADSDGLLVSGFPTIEYTTGSAGQNDHTLDFGFTQQELYSLGNQVWLDTDNNGMVDAGEDPIENVWIYLFEDVDMDGLPDDQNADGVIDETDAIQNSMTNAAGLYLFDDLPEGDYVVGIPPMEFTAGQPLEGLASSDPTEADPNTDTDLDDNGVVDPSGWIFSGAATLGGADDEPTGEDPDNDPDTPDENENLTVDFGFYEPPQEYSLGNQVWFDQNNNGLVDAGETPIEGVWVELFFDADMDGLPDDQNADGVIDENDFAAPYTSTDADGLYLFEDLAPGSYVVGIPSMEWDPDGPLYGLLSSDPTSTDANDDVDNDDNGAPGPYGAVWSTTVTLGDGEPTGEDPDNDPNTPDENENLTVDFGFYQPIFDLALFKQLEDGTNLGEFQVGDPVTFNITVINQGDVAGFEPTIVDYVPDGLTLADPDWTEQADGTATISLAGVTIQPGEQVVVPITFTIDENAAGTITNLAEIAAVTPVNELGEVVVMPNGSVLPDIDSIPDAVNSDTLLDDEITLSAATGDEDDHDQAQIVLPGTLAVTGSSTGVVALIGMLLAAAGYVMTRRRNQLETA